MSEKGHTVQVQLRTHKPRSSVRLIDNNELEFAFPAIGKDCILRMNFQRTLRVPDDEVNNLPPGLDRFELEHVEDYEGRILQEPQRISVRGPNRGRQNLRGDRG